MIKNKWSSFSKNPKSSIKKLFLLLVYLLVIKNTNSFTEDKNEDNLFDNELTKQIFINQINSTHFSCDNNTKIFPLSKLNNDYCDCEDGSDENLTNACVNGKFKCKNYLYYPKIISTNKLNDGYCDCCDGSDEQTEIINREKNIYIHQISTCSNTCIQKSNEEFDNLSNEFNELRKVISNYKITEYKEYFDFHNNLLKNIIQISQRQLKLLVDKNLISSYIRLVENHLTEEDINNENYVDYNGIKLKNLNTVNDLINEEINKNKQYLDNYKNNIYSYLNFGILKDIFNDNCLNLHNDYNDDCTLCENSFNCRSINYDFVDKVKNRERGRDLHFGKFKSFDGTTFYFDEGNRCDNYNVQLSAQIKIQCGQNELIKLVDRVNGCQYKFEYYTKLGCNNFKLNEIFNKINTILAINEKEE